jgi:hypothetical protein
LLPAIAALPAWIAQVPRAVLDLVDLAAWPFGAAGKV